MNGIYLFLYIYNFNNFINGTKPEMGVYNVTASRDRFAPAWQSIHVWLSWRGTSGVCMVKINEMIYTLLSISSEMLAFLITQRPASVCLLSVNFSNSIFNLQSISTKIRLLKTFQLLNMLSSSRLSFCYLNLLLFIWQNLQFHYSSIRFRVLVIIFKYFSISILVTLLVRGHCVNRLNFVFIFSCYSHSDITNNCSLFVL